MRSAIRREYTTLFTIICWFTAINVAGNYSVLKRFAPDPRWQVIFLCGLVLYLVVVLIKKLTPVLNAPGR